MSNKQIQAAKPTVQEQMVENIRNNTTIVKFFGRTFILDEFEDIFSPMSSATFQEHAYRILGEGHPRGKIADVEQVFRATAPDFTDRRNLIAIGDRVWDSVKACYVDNERRSSCFYRLKYKANDTGDFSKVDNFILQLANGEQAVANDIWQSIAPLLLSQKPTGVIWFLGNGANGKSTLVHLLYHIFGNYLTELTVKQLEDERDTPNLVGMLGNVCKESSESYVDDTRTYKSIGTHEDFQVHKFHSQDMVRIDGNVHHIFSANNIPFFGDKSYGARRRTLIVPFRNSFEPDDTYEQRLFTTEFIQTFVHRLTEWAAKLKASNYQYKWSDSTLAVKARYDEETNSAVSYISKITEHDGCVGFLDYRILYADYENFCNANAFVVVKQTTLRRECEIAGFIRTSRRLSPSKVGNVYMRGDYKPSEVEFINGIGYKHGLVREKKVESLEDLLDGW